MIIFTNIEIVHLFLNIPKKRNSQDAFIKHSEAKKILKIQTRKKNCEMKWISFMKNNFFRPFSIYINRGMENILWKLSREIDSFHLTTFWVLNFSIFLCHCEKILHALMMMLKNLVFAFLLLLIFFCCDFIKFFNIFFVEEKVSWWELKFEKNVIFFFFLYFLSSKKSDYQKLL